MSSLSIGIDLGTTYCCVAVLRKANRAPEIIPNEWGRNTTPSFVAYYGASDDEEDDDEGTVVGETAKDTAHENPENTIFDVKRLIGRSYYDPHVQKYMQLWPFHLTNYKGLVAVKIKDKVLLPQEIAKELVRHLVQTAEAFLGCSIKSAVITVPAYFNSLQLELTREACISAGLETIQFITEPTAAAFAYGLHSSNRTSKSPGKTRTSLIFDLGGGTFDVALLKLKPGNKVEILGIGGDARLGGEDFNDLLTEYCIEEFRKKEGIDLASGKLSDDAIIRFRAAKRLRRIRKECELQKCFLSSQGKKVIISLDGVYQDKTLCVLLKSETFEKLIHPLLSKCLKILDQILRNHGVSKGEVDDVIMIGGSTRIPKVQEIVSEYFGGKNLLRSVDADEAVACGAAIHAFNMFNGNQETAGNGLTVTETYDNVGSYASVFGHDSDTPAETSVKNRSSSTDSSTNNTVVAVALYTYQAVDQNHISLNPGDVVTNIVKIDGTWWTGECKKKVGRFPAAQVAELKEYKPYINKALDLDEPVPVKAPVQKFQPVEVPILIPFEAMNLGKETEKPEARKTAAPQPSRSRPPKPKRVIAEPIPSRMPFRLRTGMSVIAKCNYEAVEDDEISFMQGDMITDVEKLAGDWWNGKCKGKFGRFPASCAQGLKR